MLLALLWNFCFLYVWYTFLSDSQASFAWKTRNLFLQERVLIPSRLDRPFYEKFTHLAKFVFVHRKIYHAKWKSHGSKLWQAAVFGAVFQVSPAMLYSKEVKTRPNIQVCRQSVRGKNGRMPKDWSDVKAKCRCSSIYLSPDLPEASGVAKWPM